MNKLGDVVFCVDCDRERQAHLELAEAAQDPDTILSPEQDKHPRRMATKKDANGDPLCSPCLDDRQAKRRAEFMLSDDRRTVVHWPRRGRASDPKPVLLSSIDTSADPAASSAVPALPKAAVNGSRPKLIRHEPKQDVTKNKAAFVRSLPPGTPAKDVIAQAKKQGLEITPAYVYVIRSTSGARKNNGIVQDVAREVPTKSNGRAAIGRAVNGSAANGRAANGRAANGRAAIGRAAIGRLANGEPRNGQALNGRVANGRALDIGSLRIPKPKDRGIERKFMWLAVELGFLRTEQLLDELRTKIRVVFAH